jgi:hypothetical protein
VAGKLGLGLPSGSRSSELPIPAPESASSLILEFAEVDRSVTSRSPPVLLEHC